MAAFIDFIEFVFFLGNFAVLFAKMYNLSKLAKAYDPIWIFLLTMFSLFSWLMMLGYTTISPGLDTAFYLSITSFITVLNVVLTIAELFLFFGSYFAEKSKKGGPKLIDRR